MCLPLRNTIEGSAYTLRDWSLNGTKRERAEERDEKIKEEEARGNIIIIINKIQSLFHFFHFFR